MGHDYLAAYLHKLSILSPLHCIVCSDTSCIMDMKHLNCKNWKRNQELTEKQEITKGVNSEATALETNHFNFFLNKQSYDLYTVIYFDFVTWVNSFLCNRIVVSCSCLYDLLFYLNRKSSLLSVNLNFIYIYIFNFFMFKWMLGSLDKLLVLLVDLFLCGFQIKLFSVNFFRNIIYSSKCNTDWWPQWKST